MRSIWLRRALLAASLFLAGWVALYLFGSAGRPEPAQEARTSEILGEEDVARGEGFDVSVYDGENLVFRLSGETFVNDAEGHISLENVHLEATREGRLYKIWSRSATYDPETEEALLEGNVRLEGPDALVVETEKIALLEKGRELHSQAPVAFAWGEGVLGRAQRLRSDFESRLHHLGGQVLIRRSPAEGSEEKAIEIRAAKVSLDREGQLLRADGNAQVDYGASRLQARRLSAHLTEDGKRVSFLHASWNVVAFFEMKGRAGELARYIEAEGHSISALMDDSGEHPEEVEIEGDKGHPGTLRLSDETSRETTLEAPYLSADFRAGIPSLVETWGGVSIREGLSFDRSVTMRQLCADAVDASFLADGTLSEVHLDRDVHYHEGAMQVIGDEARLNQAVGRATVLGDPARVLHPRAELQAPRLTYTEASGVLRAEEGVSGLLRDLDQSGLSATPLGGGGEDGPLFVQSREAILEGKRAFSFLGEVRAWRDEALLTSDQLRGDTERGELAASGSVRTVFTPSVEEGSEDRGPVDVTAERLSYREEENLLVYSGTVVVLQQQRRLSCDEAQISLREGGRGSSVDWMDCVGHTRFSDPATQREAEAQRALYRPEEEMVELFGSPAKFSDSQGHRMEGRRMIYDLATGAVRIRSEVSSPGPGG